MAYNRTENLFDIGESSEVECSHSISVAFDSGVDSEFNYLVSDELWPVKPGQRVEVPFGRSNKKVKAFCLEVSDNSENSFNKNGKKIKLKKVKKIIDKKPLLDDSLLELAKWISDYYVAPIGQVLAAMIPSAVKKGVGSKKKKYIFLAKDFEQKRDSLSSKRQKQILEFLKQRSAVDPDHAIEEKEILEEVGCTKRPLKKLIENKIAKFIRRTVFQSLPAIPENLVLEKEVVELNDYQKQALAHLSNTLKKDEFSVSLLYGVTDSGKTEVYIRAIEECIKQGRSAIVLLPEIALTAQTVSRFSSRFEKIAIMHSGLTAAQRNTQWQKIRSGQADVVIGARSAIFAPLPTLGLIVIDEEHEPSYKQDKTPRYNARDVAVKRAHMNKAVCLLGSATPSLNSLLNCKQKEHFTLLRLPKRVMDLPMPKMKVVDMAQQKYASKNLLSETLEKHLQNVLEKEEQAILFLNRRGYSNFIYCPSCGYRLHCGNCDVTLTFHRNRMSAKRKMPDMMKKHMGSGYAICHYCGSQTLAPRQCPLCSKNLTMIGQGSQKLEEEIQKKFPDARIARIDSDSMKGKDYYKLLERFSNGKIDILSGTQILAKGLHFPNVTLVGIISADTCLYIPDFRSNERTFQLISQVSGRTGRSEKKGTVYIQTFLPDQPAIKYAANNDFQGFVKEELQHRKNCNLPPYWRLATITLRDTSFEKLEKEAAEMKNKVDEIIKRFGLDIKMRGPMEPPIARIQKFHRLHMIIQAPDAGKMKKLFSELRKTRHLYGSVRVTIDIDPLNLL